MQQHQKECECECESTEYGVIEYRSGVAGCTLHVRQSGDYDDDDDDVLGG